MTATENESQAWVYIDTDLGTPMLPSWAAFLGDKAWEHALSEFRVGNRKWLSQLTVAYLARPEIVARFVETPPDAARNAIAKIIAGTMKPDGRGQSRRKLSRNVQVDALAQARSWRSQREEMLRDTARIEATAVLWKCEVPDVIKWINAQYRTAVGELAKNYGVSPATLKDLLKPSAQKNRVSSRESK